MHRVYFIDKFSISRTFVFGRPTGGSSWNLSPLHAGSRGNVTSLLTRTGPRLRGIPSAGGRQHVISLPILRNAGNTRRDAFVRGLDTLAFPSSPIWEIIHDAYEDRTLNMEAQHDEVV